MRDNFSIFFNMKIYCVLSNTHTIYHFIIKEEPPLLDYPKSEGMGYFPKDSRTSSNEPSVFEPLKFCCICSM